MNLDWNHFTPWASLAGGLLIGVATALYLLGDGRIAGIAGIVSAPLRALLTGGNLAAERVRLLFIGGLLIAPWAWQLFAREMVDPTPALDHMVETVIRPRMHVLRDAFMGAGAAAVFVARHVL